MDNYPVKLTVYIEGSEKTISFDQSIRVDSLAGYPFILACQESYHILEL